MVWDSNIHKLLLLSFLEWVHFYFNLKYLLSYACLKLWRVLDFVARTLDSLKQTKEIQAKVKEQTSIILEKSDPTGHDGMSIMVNYAEHQ